MEHEVRVDPKAELALVRFRGRVDLESLFDVLGALSEEGFRAGHKILWDAQAVKETVLRPGDLERLMEFYSEKAGGGEGHVREAALVERPLDYSVAQLYKVLARRGGYEVGVCWRLEEALDYLGLEEMPDALKREPL